MMKLNQGVEALLSGTPVATLLTAQTQFLCEAQFTPPAPSVLQVSARSLSVGSVAPQSNQAPWLWPGLNNFTTRGAGNNPDFSGIFVEYGENGVRRRFMMDARAGTYQLPPCDNVKVSIRSFTTGGGWSNSQGFKATLHEGVSSETLWPTFTFAGSLAAAATNSFNPPPQARLFDFWGAIAAGNLSIAATAGDVFWQRANLTGIYLPPWGPFDIGISNDEYTVTNNAAAADVFTGRFYLEP